MAFSLDVLHVSRSLPLERVAGLGFENLALVFLVRRKRQEAAAGLVVCSCHQPARPPSFASPLLRPFPGHGWQTSRVSVLVSPAPCSPLMATDDDSDHSASIVQTLSIDLLDSRRSCPSLLEADYRPSLRHDYREPDRPPPDKE